MSEQSVLLAVPVDRVELMREILTEHIEHIEQVMQDDEIQWESLGFQPDPAHQSARQGQIDFCKAMISQLDLEPR